MQAVRSLRLLARNTLNTVSRRNYGHGRKHKYPTMNDMPVPEGDYWALHAERQRRYNMRLALGVTMSGLGIFVLTTDKVIHFHWSPPDTYE